MAMIKHGRAVPPPPVAWPNGAPSRAVQPKFQTRLPMAVLQRASTLASAPSGAGPSGGGGGGKPPYRPPLEDQSKEFSKATGKSIAGRRVTPAQMRGHGFASIGGSGWLRAPTGTWPRLHAWGVNIGGDFMLQGITFGDHGARDRETFEFGSVGFDMIALAFGF